MNSFNLSTSLLFLAMLAGCNDPSCGAGCKAGILGDPRGVACGPWKAKDSPPCYCWEPYNFTCENTDPELTFMLNRTSAALFEPSLDVEAILTTALAAWSSLSHMTLTLSTADTDEELVQDGNANVVYFTDDRDDCSVSDDSEGGCANSWGADVLQEREADCDIAILDDLPEDCSGCAVGHYFPDDLEIEMEHELGHCLGFAHNTFGNSIMQKDDVATEGLTGPGDEDSMAVAYLYDDP